MPSKVMKTAKKPPRNVFDWKKVTTLFSSAYKGHFFNVLVYQTGIKFLVNPLHPNISLHILYTVLYTFPKVLTRRICLTIMRSFT